jgi:hypothetical protein
MDMSKRPTQKDVINRTAETMPAKKEYTPELFVAMYNKLCAETGFTLGTHPEFTYRDDNTFSVIVVMTVEKMPEKK